MEQSVEGRLRNAMESSSLVSSVEADSDFVFVISVDSCSSQEFRSQISKRIHEEFGSKLSLEIRTKEDEDGFIAIVGENVEHPMQLVTLYCGVLELSDRHTYQSLTKVSDLPDSLHRDGQEAEFAAAVVQVVASVVSGEPMDTDEISDILNLDFRTVRSNTARIIQHIQS